jgi:hypothetical protein
MDITHPDPNADPFQCVIVAHSGGRIGQSVFQMCGAYACAGFLYVNHQDTGRRWETYLPGTWREAIGIASDGTELYRLLPSVEEEL